VSHRAGGAVTAAILADGADHAQSHKIGGLRVEEASSVMAPDPNQAGQPAGLDGDFELLDAVHLDHRHAQAVSSLEVLVAVDEGLLETEGPALPFGQDHRPRLVAEP